MSDIPVGSVVRLKSGSLPMTVARIVGANDRRFQEGHVVVVYWNGEDLASRSFDPGVLESCDPLDARGAMHLARYRGRPAQQSES